MPITVSVIRPQDFLHSVCYSTAPPRLPIDLIFGLEPAGGRWRLHVIGHVIDFLTFSLDSVRQFYIQLVNMATKRPHPQQVYAEGAIVRIKLENFINRVPG